MNLGTFLGANFVGNLALNCEEGAKGFRGARVGLRVNYDDFSAYAYRRNGNMSLGAGCDS